MCIGIKYSTVDLVLVVCGIIMLSIFENEYSLYFISFSLAAISMYVIDIDREEKEAKEAMIRYIIRADENEIV